MKLCYINGAIEVAPRQSWTERLEFTVNSDNNELNFRYPYGDITPEQAAAVSTFVKTITDAYSKLIKQIDAVNKDLRLEQYAPIASSQAGTVGADFDLDANSAVPQPARGASSTEIAELTIESAKDDEEKLQAMVASGLKEEAETKEDIN